MREAVAGDGEEDLRAHMSTIGIGLIGLGWHGMRYLRHLHKDVTDGRLVAVCRRNAVEGSAIEAEYGVRCYQDYRDLVADPAVEAVVVVTPPAAAPSICLNAVAARKPLLIEKPLAPTGAEAREMVLAADGAGVPLMTAQTLRFEPAVRFLRNEVAALGRPKYLSLCSRVEPRPHVTLDPTAYGGRGVLLEVGVHLLDLVRYLTGEEVVVVRCETENPGPGKPERRALATLQTSSGLPCIVDVARLAPGRVGRCEWIGEDGQLHADWARHRVYRYRSGQCVEEQETEERATVVETLHAFLSALKAGTAMPVTGLDGQRAVEIADACYRSAETGQVVRL